MIFENNELQFINHEEGRVVMTGAAPEYQHHLKDHLGNVRLTLTSTPGQETAATAGFEPADMAEEQGEFLHYAHARRVQATLFDRTNGSSPGYSQRLNGSEKETYGLAKSLAVMPGDVVNAEVYVKYADPESSNWNTALTNLMLAIANNTGGIIVDGEQYPTALTENDFPGVVNTGSSSAAVPKAFLNWMVFDADFQLLDGGFIQVSTSARETGADGPHERLAKDNIAITQPGYVYIYLSNENGDLVEVFFDDFEVEHVHGEVVQVDDYYPFGLAFNSYQRENSVDQRWKFQGQEHIDDLGLNWDSFKWRNHQPDIGRFFNIDPIAEEYYYNSPYAFSENKVTAHVELEGLESKYFMDRRSSVENTDPYLNTDRQGRQIEVTRYNGLGEENGRATVTMSGNVDASKVTDRSAAVIGEIAIASGESNVRVSSVARDAEDQARAMFTNLEGSGPGQGIPAQRRLYGGKPGGEVIKTYTKAKGLQALANQFGGTVSNEQVKGMMESKINELGVQNVTRHASDDPTINVLDIAPSSVQNTKQFVEAGKEHPRVQKFIPYPKDPGHHFEIKQD